ncbi:MAG: CapA family protein [Alphaproteobacteria bacterium]
MANNNLKIFCVGDFCPLNKTKERIENKESFKIIEPFKNDISKSDITVLNLEAPLTKSLKKAPKFGINLKLDPICADFLKQTGFNLAVCANNHIGDYENGIEDSIKTLNEYKINYIGMGKNLSEAQSPFILEKNGFKAAFIALAENEFGMAEDNKGGSSPLSPIQNVLQIQNLKKENNFVVVFIHGGNEYCPFPSPNTVKLYREYTNAGADAVIASHTHCPQGYEEYNNSIIVYSLGNFIFDKIIYKNLKSKIKFLIKSFLKTKTKKLDLFNTSYAATIELAANKKPNIEIIPFEFLEDETTIKKLENDGKNYFLSYLKYISDIAQNSSKLKLYWDNWCFKHGKNTLNIIKKTKNFFLIKNILTCEAHINLVQNYLTCITKNKKEDFEISKNIKMLQDGYIPKKKENNQ